MSRPFYHVKKRTLLAIAGCVWLIAGFNVARLGIIAYINTAFAFWQPLVSLAVFAAFGTMFYKMSGKHCRRIRGYTETTRPFWNFFDLKAYCIMVSMMGGGIWLRYSGLVPELFIAVFYTGLGCALAGAGILFWVMFFRYNSNAAAE
ncbi:MAG: hypothetical protein ACI4JY_11405 [Oscillospiraceae bacterium]